MQKNLVVLGAGESGYGTAVLGMKKGWNVFVSDNGKIKSEYIDKFKSHNIEFEECGHNRDRILSATTIVKSPGIPDNAPLVTEARNNGIPVISEIEFAGRYTDSRKICITGSNGKTTTTTLIYEILKKAGFNVEAAGNIGESFAEKVSRDKQPDWYVIELSSFQLDGMFDFKADIALLLNITPDHLNRYDYKMENYVNSKFRISRNQGANDYFISNADDPETLNALSRVVIGGKHLLFSSKGTSADARYESGNLIFEDFTISGSELQIKGIHNMANALAAIIAAKKAGVGNKDLTIALREFKGVEHRMENAGEFEGVLWINDSKATNVDSVTYALGAMTRPTIWIAGGTDKGNDYSVLHQLVREHVRALVCMGEDNRKLLESFTGIVPEIYDTHTFEDAMKTCKDISHKGDCVLLSPACASFDLFDNYEHRGRCFKNWLTNLYLCK